MNRIIAILFVYTVVLSLKAQIEPADSISIKLVDSLLNEAHTAMLDVDIKKTIDLSSRALDLSTQTNYQLGTVRSYYTLGQGLFNNQEYNESLSYLSKATRVNGHNKYPLYMSQI